MMCVCLPRNAVAKQLCVAPCKTTLGQFRCPARVVVAAAKKGTQPKGAKGSRSVGKGLTPYQGPMRCYGFFKCSKCSGRWTSGNSWADCGQDCKRCLIKVYPYKQERLQELDEDEE